ncbi:MAG: hypothetical protein ACLRMZ_12315 [Blautia marasmi]
MKLGTEKEIMHILEINKFLFPNGGSETYIFKLGEQLQKMGHEVSTSVWITKAVALATGSMLTRVTWIFTAEASSKLTYPIKTIYSKEARIQLKKFWMTSSQMSVT